ncbi:MAG: hypothetical protein WCO51_08750 [bacterium]|jgi:hypothetical protein
MTWQRKLGLIGVAWTASLIVAGAFQISSINLDIDNFADTFNIPREIVMLIISILLIQKDRLTRNIALGYTFIGAILGLALVVAIAAPIVMASIPGNGSRFNYFNLITLLFYVILNVQLHATGWKWLKEYSPWDLYGE